MWGIGAVCDWHGGKSRNGRKSGSHLTPIVAISQLCDNTTVRGEEAWVNGEFTIEYVELPNGRIPEGEFVASLDEKAAARVDAFIERLRIYGNRMQGKFVKKLTDNLLELRIAQFDRIFRVHFFYRPGMLIVSTIRISEENRADSCQ
jgi:hypothetical protein